MTAGDPRLAGSDEGSAVVEFVLVTLILIPLFMALLQLAFVLHVRNTLVAASAEGARYAANADRDVNDGISVTEDIIRESLNDDFARNVSGGRESVAGVPTVYVEVSASMPLVGWFAGLSGGLVVRGHAMAELP